MICIPSTLEAWTKYVIPTPEYAGPRCARCGAKASLETLTVNGREETWLRCLRYAKTKHTRGPAPDICPTIRTEALMQFASEAMQARYKAIPGRDKTRFLAVKLGVENPLVTQFFQGTRKLSEQQVAVIEEGLAYLERPPTDSPAPPVVVEPVPVVSRAPASVDAWDLGKAIRAHLAELLALPGGRVVLRAAIEDALRAEAERLKAELAALKPAPPTCGECGGRVCLTCDRKGLHPVPCPECGMGWSACFPTCRECGTEMHQEASADGPRLFCPGCGCKP